MNYYGYVYKTINSVNSKIYIGQNKGFFNPEYLGSGKLLKRAIKKYGKDEFILSLVKKAKNKKELNRLEIKNISRVRKLFGTKNIYNLTEGGEGGSIKGRKVSKETLKRMKFRVVTLEHKRNISLGLIGKPTGMRFFSPKERLKRSIALSGIPKSKNVIEKMKKSQRKRRQNETEKDKIKFSKIMKKWWKDRKE